MYNQASQPASQPAGLPPCHALLFSLLHFYGYKFRPALQTHTLDGEWSGAMPWMLVWAGLVGVAHKTGHMLLIFGANMLTAR